MRKLYSFMVVSLDGLYEGPNGEFDGMGLVDELRIMIHPILLGGGRSLFRTLGDRLPLELLQTRTFRSGNVLLTYRPA
jgi:riboflavin biosynthesis pyrimidine reductase